MKTTETNHNNNRLDRLLNSWPFLVDTEQVKTLFAFAYCKEGGEWRWFRDDKSLFNNGTVFVRYTVSPISLVTMAAGAILPWFIGWPGLLPFIYGLFLHISWRVSGNRRYLQAGFGPKLNGRLGAIFRIPKNDEQSSKGAHEGAPNSNQAPNWDCGTK